MYSSGLSLRRARTSSQLSCLGRDVRKSLLICIEDDWRDQTVLDGDSHTDVYTMELPDRVASPVRIHFRMLRECRRSRLYDDVVERHLVLGALCDHRLAQLSHASEIELGGEIERRNGPNRFAKTLGDRLPHLRERNVLIVANARSTWGWSQPQR